MTAQIGDFYHFKSENYKIIALSNPVLFRPQDYHIEPLSICSACWAGYWCEYDITIEGIFLRNLYINSKNGYYPKINHIKASKESIAHKKRGFLYMGHHLYQNINLPIFYTGKIVAGKDFISKYHIHMGYQRAWAYQAVLEFIFLNGKLAETIDHSKFVQELRTEIACNPSNFKNKVYSNTKDFVADSFSLELSKKCWWIS